MEDPYYRVFVQTKDGSSNAFFFSYFDNALCLYHVLSESDNVTAKMIFDVNTGKCLLEWYADERDEEESKRFKVTVVTPWVFTDFCKRNVYYDDGQEAIDVFNRAREYLDLQAIRVVDQETGETKAEWLRDEKWGEVL